MLHIHPQLQTLPFVHRHSCLPPLHPPPPPLLWCRGVAGTYSSPPYCNSSSCPFCIEPSCFCAILLPRSPYSESSLLISSQLHDLLRSIDARMHKHGHKRTGRHLTPLSPVVSPKAIYKLLHSSLPLLLSLPADSRLPAVSDTSMLLRLSSFSSSPLHLLLAQQPSPLSDVK